MLENKKAINKLYSLYLKHKFSDNLDDAVGMYIAYALLFISLPSFQEVSDYYIRKTRKEVNNLVKKTNDRDILYSIYKINGDNILLNFGLFEYQLKLNKGYTIKNLKYYYEQTIKNKTALINRSVIFDVFKELCENIDIYIALLRQMKGDFFKFYDTFEDKYFKEFLDEVDIYEKRCNLNKKQDEFLEHYAEYLKKPNNLLKKKINLLCNEITKIDKNFKFKVE